MEKLENAVAAKEDKIEAQRVERDEVVEKNRTSSDLREKIIDANRRELTSLRFLSDQNKKRVDEMKGEIDGYKKDLETQRAINQTQHIELVKLREKTQTGTEWKVTLRDLRHQLAISQQTEHDLLKKLTKKDKLIKSLEEQMFGKRQAGRDYDAEANKDNRYDYGN